MGEFRIGRTRAQHSYPDRWPGSPLALLGRNFAFGPKADLTILEAGSLIPWAFVESAAAWDATVTYAAGDIVQLLGSTAISLLDNNLNHVPAGGAPWWAVNTDVPLTPRSTGIVVIQGVMYVNNAAVTVEEVTFTVLVDGNPVSAVIEIELPAASTVAIPVLTEVIAPFAIGVRGFASIELIASVADDITLLGDLSTALEVREMWPVTG